MTHKEKHFAAAICAVLMIVSCSILFKNYIHSKEEHRVNSPVMSETEDSAAIRDFPTGYRCTTTGSDLNVRKSGNISTSKRTFAHKIQGPEGNCVTTITTTVTGTVSDTQCCITHISTDVSSESAEGLTISEHYSGETATVIVYSNQISVCHFQYRLAQDGSIVFL